MSKEKFQEMRFRADSLAAIATANRIVDQYLRQGFKLTLRQLYYQHVARGLIENTEKSYKNLGDLISKARLAGLIDWGAIEDRTRSLRGMTHWETPAQIINATHHSFFLSRWETQNHRLECWIEKDALTGVIAGVCRTWDIDFFSCRGYVSQSEMYDASKRIARYISSGQTVIILHLGDHDPSGLDMTRDLNERLRLMLPERMSNKFVIKRLALNYNQVEQYAPPPNPAKTTDSRFKAYQDEHGDYSWELDALDPTVISALIEENIKPYVDFDFWERTQIVEEKHKKLLLKVSSNWEKVVEFLKEV